MVATSPTTSSATSPSALERRKEARYAIHWKATIIWTEGDDRYWEDVRTTDLSLEGASVYCEHNLKLPPSCSLLLSMPPLLPESQPELLRIECKYSYSVYADHVGLFRIGLTFLNIKGDVLKVLQQRLSQYQSFSGPW